MLYYDDARHANLYVVEPEGVRKICLTERGCGVWWVGSLLPGIGAGCQGLGPAAPDWGRLPGIGAAGTLSHRGRVR